MITPENFSGTAKGTVSAGKRAPSRDRYRIKSELLPYDKITVVEFHQWFKIAKLWHPYLGPEAAGPNRIFEENVVVEARKAFANFWHNRQGHRISPNREALFLKKEYRGIQLPFQRPARRLAVRIQGNRVSNQEKWTIIDNQASDGNELIDMESALVNAIPEEVRPPRKFWRLTEMPPHILTGTGLKTSVFAKVSDTVAKQVGDTAVHSRNTSP